MSNKECGEKTNHCAGYVMGGNEINTEINDVSGGMQSDFTVSLIRKGGPAITTLLDWIDR